MTKTILAATAATLVATSAFAQDSTSNKEIVGTFLGAVVQGDTDTMRSGPTRWYRSTSSGWTRMDGSPNTGMP